MVVVVVAEVVVVEPDVVVVVVEVVVAEVVVVEPDIVVVVEVDPKVVVGTNVVVVVVVEGRGLRTFELRKLVMELVKSAFKASGDKFTPLPLTNSIGEP